MSKPFILTLSSIPKDHQDLPFAPWGQNSQGKVLKGQRRGRLIKRVRTAPLARGHSLTERSLWTGRHFGGLWVAKEFWRLFCPSTPPFTPSFAHFRGCSLLAVLLKRALAHPEGLPSLFSCKPPKLPQTQQCPSNPRELFSLSLWGLCSLLPMTLSQGYLLLLGIHFCTQLVRQ